MYKLAFNTKKYEIELNLRRNVTVLTGDSATGKSYFYNMMHRILDSKNVILKNFESLKTVDNYEEFKNTIIKNRNSKVPKLYVIDQIDDIQRIDDELLREINKDVVNNYILIGRAPNLNYNMSDLARIKIDENKISLEYILPMPMVIGGRHR